MKKGPKWAVHWYLTWIGIPLCVLTWAIGALLLFFFSPIIGGIALFFALVLTESLLGAYRAQQSAVGDRK